MFAGNQRQSGAGRWLQLAYKPSQPDLSVGPEDTFEALQGQLVSGPWAWPEHSVHMVGHTAQASW